MIFTLTDGFSQNDNAGLASHEASIDREESTFEFKSPNIESSLSWVNVADAEIDAYSAISKKDHRFIGYYHPIFNLPIVPEDNGCRFRGMYAVKTRIVFGPLPGDRVKENEEIIAKFDQYVEQYNSLIKAYLIDSMGLKCGS